MSLRRFSYNLLLTSDYYPKKLQLGGEEVQFKMYLGLVVFRFYSLIGEEWDLLRKFFSGFLANGFFKFGRFESALYFYGQKLRSLQFEQMSRSAIEFHLSELKLKYLPALFPNEEHYLLSNLFM